MPLTAGGTLTRVLRETALVIHPGDILVIRVPWETTASQRREYGESIAAWNDTHPGEPLRAVVVPCDSLAVQEASSESGPADGPPGTFLDDCREDVYRSAAALPAVRLLHAPSGCSVQASASTVLSARQDAIRELGEILVSRGHITVNQMRAALALPPWPRDAAANGLAPPPAASESGVSRETGY